MNFNVNENALQIIQKVIHDWLFLSFCTVLSIALFAEVNIFTRTLFTASFIVWVCLATIEFMKNLHGVILPGRADPHVIFKIIVNLILLICLSSVTYLAVNMFNMHVT